MKKKKVKEIKKKIEIKDQWIIKMRKHTWTFNYYSDAKAKADELLGAGCWFMNLKKSSHKENSK